MSDHAIDIAVERIARTMEWGTCASCDADMLPPTLIEIASGYDAYCPKCGRAHDNGLDDLAKLVTIELAILRNPMKLLEGLLP